MYLPAHFEETRPEILHALMRDCPLATLVVSGADGLDANHVPLQLVAVPGEPDRLRGHVARANPLWKQAAGGIPALAIFHGAEAYVSPGWYPTKQRHGKAVPTWNYAVVHAHGTLRAIDDAGWLRAQVGALTRAHEAGREKPWHVGEAPADYIDGMIKAIVGIELTITRLTGKWKTSQNQPAENQLGVIAGLQGEARPGAQSMVPLVQSVLKEPA